MNNFACSLGGRNLFVHIGMLNVCFRKNLVNGPSRHNFHIPPSNQAIQAAMMFLEVRHGFFFGPNRQKNHKTLGRLLPNTPKKVFESHSIAFYGSKMICRS
jgi:hypothetical protein